jgi:adenylate kinase
MKFAIVPIGAPGAGKGTQSKILAEKLRYPHVSTGEILRAASELVVVRDGQEVTIGEVLAKGEFATDEEMIEIILDRFSQPDVSRGIILDGYPRNIAQAEMLEGICRDAGFAEPIAIELTLDSEVAVQRLLERNEGRADDTEETIRKRMQIYEERTAPIVGFYRSRGRLVSIDGDRPVGEVSADFEAAHKTLVESAAPA